MDSDVNKTAGVTLIELMITISILVILLAIADPSYQYITNSNRIAAEVNGLLGDIQYARSQAIKQGQTITVCESSDGINCGNQNTWQNGWIVFFDADGNGAINGTEVALRVQKPFIGSDTFISTNTISIIQFNREGFASGVPNGTLFQLHDSSNSTNWTRCLSVNLSGLSVIEKYNTTINGVKCT